jgi:[ribosomal protein S5]-alanine N-acetyltransferase
MFDFSYFPTLRTQRLILRELVPEDAEAIFAIRGDYEVTRLNTGEAYYRVEQAAALIRSIRNAYDEQSELRWGITLKGTNVVIGMCGYNYWVRRDYRGCIGYDLARAYWGQGIMTEAVRSVIRFGFERMQLNRIEADASAENIASIRVLEKLGFKQEGIEREQYYEDGQFHDLVLFALLRREYQAP